MPLSALCHRWLRLAALLVLATVAACSPPPQQRLLNDTASSLLSTHRDFALASAQLYEASQRFCQAPDQAGFEASRERWRHSAVAWSALQFHSAGPLMADNTSWKIQFWPDRKNLVARKLEALLNSDAAIDRDSIAASSVVIQGLSALEYLLFDPKAGQLSRYQDQPSRRCAALTAIALYQQQLSEQLHRDWLPEHGNYLATFTEPGADNPRYPDHRQAIASIVESLVTGAELIKRDKLERPLGLASSSDHAQVYLLEWWRSGFSRQAMIGNLNAMERLYLADQLYGLDDYLREHQHGALADQIISAFEHSIAAAQAVDGSLFDAATQPEQQAALTQLYQASLQLLSLLKNALPDALGITLSFNGADGD